MGNIRLIRKRWFAKRPGDFSGPLIQGVWEMIKIHIYITALIFFRLGIPFSTIAQTNDAVEAEKPYRFGTPINLGSTINSPSHEATPFISQDGLSLFFSSDRPGGSGDFDLWYSTRPTLDAPWSDPVNLGPSVNSSDEDYYPSVSYDNLSLYFYSTRQGGEGGSDIWVSTRTSPSDPWREAENLGPSINSLANEAAPCLSADGLSFLFRSTRSRGFGSADIWLSTRPTVGDPWGAPVNLGPTINGSEWDCGVHLSADGLSLFFHSNRSGGLGNFDFYLSTRNTREDDWSTPVNLGETINTPNNDFCPSFSANNRRLYFCDDTFGGPVRPRGFGKADLWEVEQVFPSAVRDFMLH